MTVGTASGRASDCIFEVLPSGTGHEQHENDASREGRIRCHRGKHCEQRFREISTLDFIEFLPVPAYGPGKVDGKESPRHL